MASKKFMMITTEWLQSKIHASYEIISLSSREEGSMPTSGEERLVTMKKVALLKFLLGHPQIRYRPAQGSMERRRETLSIVLQRRCSSLVFVVFRGIRWRPTEALASQRLFRPSL